jgi:GntR family transcriptional regulator, carbon starvation induced regulator
MSNNRLLVLESMDQRATLASRVAASLRSRIVGCDLPPAMQLRVQSLAEQYAVAASSVREALNRLASEGLVAAHDMRGFFVSPVGEAELDELTRTRCWLNEIALRQSILNGGAPWEEGVVLAFHRLSRTPRRQDNGRTELWTEAHRAFHRALTAGCCSAILVGMCDQLFMQAERYRNLSRQAAAADPVQRDDEHRAIMDAALTHDADHAVHLVGAHFRRTAELCRALLVQSVPNPAAALELSR